MYRINHSPNVELMFSNAGLSLTRCTAITHDKRNTYPQYCKGQSHELRLKLTRCRDRSPDVRLTLTAWTGDTHQMYGWHSPDVRLTLIRCTASTHPMCSFTHRYSSHSSDVELPFTCLTAATQKLYISHSPVLHRPFAKFTAATHQV